MHGSSDQPAENPSEHQDLGVSEKRLILIAALTQGLALYALKFFDAVADWSPVWQYLGYTVVIAIPPLVILSVAPRLARGYWWVIGGFTLLLALLASYRGYQCTPADTIHCGWPKDYAIAMVIAAFIVVFLLRASATTSTTKSDRLQRPSYPAQFHYSWDVALTAGLTLVFTGIFWMILFLWQSLFKLVGVDFFRELFEKDWFFYPVTWLVAGCGAILFRSQQSFVLTLKRLLRTMLVALLPLLAVLTVMFLATLPFTGLQPIWDTGHGSALLLWLLALLLFFTNGVIQDEFPFARYPKWINRLLLLALVVAPVYAGFALYGIFLRVQQYGWTPERLWGFVVALTLTLLAVCYSISILRRGGHWAEWLPRINTGLALWVLAVCLVTQSPLANFWKISAGSQLARLQEGRIELADFDFLRHKLGRPGLEALQQAKSLPVVQQNEAVAEYIDKILANTERHAPFRENPLKEKQRQGTLKDLAVLPEGASLGESFTFDSRYHGCLDTEHRQCFWLVQDMDGDGSDEYLLFAHSVERAEHRNNHYLLEITLYGEVDGLWRVIHRNSREIKEDPESLKQAVASGKFSLRPPRWQALYLNDEPLFDPTQ
ncbi:DUF4153 domain-containing protein [uncultured Microbulbifer sp.]|uniref:DUF4153 domain-containing protein n=1 Tax=uncultured Microbulbifer sp. TaxID=348147 RepID=UPI0026128F9F|nr:DUF4153 domain-containing protein [uncultured Microbulbifer sp.]